MTLREKIQERKAKVEMDIQNLAEGAGASMTTTAILSTTKNLLEWVLDEMDKEGL